MGEVGAKSADSQKPNQDPKESPLGKIKIELPNAASSSSCPFHNWFYIAVALFALSYAVYLQDRHVFFIFPLCMLFGFSSAGKVGNLQPKVLAWGA